MFRTDTALPEPVSDWHLVEPPRLSDQLPPDTLLASPDFDRLASVLPGFPHSGIRMLRENCQPTAECLGRLALRFRAAGIAGEPATPIYLHPPV